VTSGSEIRSLKISEPSSLLAQEYTAALMRVTLGSFGGVLPAELNSEKYRTGSGKFGSGSENLRSVSGNFERGADDGGVLTEGDILDLCCDGVQKKMLPNTQSIEGL